MNNFDAMFLMLTICISFIGCNASASFSAVGGNPLINPTSQLEKSQAQQVSQLSASALKPLPEGAFSPDQVNVLPPPPPPGSDFNAAALVNWYPYYDKDDSFDPVRGVFEAPSSGKYMINAHLGVFSPVSIKEKTVFPLLVLVQNNSKNEPNILAFDYPVLSIVSNVTFNSSGSITSLPVFSFGAVNKWNIDISAKIKKGDTLRLYFEDEPGFPTLSSGDNGNTGLPLPFRAWTVTSLSATFTVYKID